MSEIIDLDMLNIDNKVEETTKSLTCEDALVTSMDKFGKVKMSYIMDVTHKSLPEVLNELDNLIFEIPNVGNCDIDQMYIIKNEYLCGNIKTKLEEAKLANDIFKGRYDKNVKALRKIMPKFIEDNDIYVSLGSPWIPTKVILAFLKYLNGDKVAFYSEVFHNEETGSWAITNKNVARNPRLTTTYGTSRMSAFEIIEHILNQTDIDVYKLSHPGTKKRVIDVEETLQANEKAKIIKNEFQGWILSSDDKRKAIEKYYFNKFATYIKKEYDGSFLTFPEKSKDITLRDYQRDAVARIILSSNTLLAHDVGSGKTYEMIAAGEELLRMGLSTKNLYVVPNGLIAEWKKSFAALYPNSKVLVVEPKNYTPAKRQDTIQKMLDPNNRVVLMPYSIFDTIKVSKDTELESLKNQIQELEHSLDYSYNVTRISKIKLNALKKRYSKMILEPTKPNEVTFEKFGFTRMFVDEAHNYKNLNIGSNDINTSTSAKCDSFYNKVCHIQKINGGKGVVLATATPLTNSLCELFVMMKYLQRGELKILGLDNFIAWISNFAEKEVTYELSVALNSYKAVSRYSKFHNLKELQNILSYVMDFHKIENMDGLPEFKGYKDQLLSSSKDFKGYLDTISERATRIESGQVDRKEDNYLLITSDGRKAALDLRLVAHNYEPSRNLLSGLIKQKNGKINACVENVYQIYKNGNDDKLTQLIFCDISIPSSYWNVYDEVKNLLIRRGIPESHISFIQDFDSVSERNTLMKKFNNGDIRILIGSTFKLGTGMNLQTKLKAIHHLDIPWRPSDMVQREGRIIRLGNENKEVDIYRYILEGSFDAYMWQTLERKQRFIEALLSSRADVSSADDIGETVLDYAEIKTLAIGDKSIKERFQLQNEIYRLKALQKKQYERSMQLTKELNDAVEMKDILFNRLTAAKLDSPKIKSYARRSNSFAKKESARYIRRMYFANINNPNEVYISRYGYLAVLKPAGYFNGKYELLLRGSGSYTLEIIESDLGIYQRLENFISNFSKYIDDLKTRLAQVDARIKEMNETKFSSYIDNINDLEIKLMKIDREHELKMEKK